MKNLPDKHAAEPYYNVSPSALLRPLLGNPVGALLVHWVFQGLPYMDTTERLFKVLLEVPVIAALTPLLRLAGMTKWARALLVAFLIAHTLNFVFNGQIWVVLKHFGLVRHDRAIFEQYLSNLSDRIKDEPSITYAAVYGSITRAEWKPTSDLDVRLVRKTGAINGFKACWFVLLERFRAFRARFPLDAFVLDSRDKLAGLRADEPPHILVDTLT
jgi:hypothetical protein